MKPERRKTEEHGAPRKPWSRTTKIWISALAVVGLIGALYFRRALGEHLESSKEFRSVALAALGAACAGLPNLISDNRGVRWATAAVAAFCVGWATYDVAVDFEHQKKELETKVEALSVVLSGCKELQPEERSIVIVRMADELKHLLNDLNQPKAVLALCAVLNDIDPGNGHAAYYSGEAYRILKDPENMRGHFKLYLSRVDVSRGATEGTVTEGYRKARGYFGERTAWILHLMANDALGQGMALDRGAERQRLLKLAIEREEACLKIARSIGIGDGFEKTMSFRGSLDVIDAASAGLK